MEYHFFLNTDYHNAFLSFDIASQAFGLENMKRFLQDNYFWFVRLLVAVRQNFEFLA